MPSPKKNSQPATPNSTGRGINYAAMERDNGDEDERVTARKVEMLQRRQVELDVLMDSHDDLVREAFQLEKFVTLLSYDPEVAKQDNSKVFIEYKAPHDLLSKTVAASESSRKSRKTRRATTEFRETLAATISAGPSTPPTTPSTPAKGNSKGPELDLASPLQSIGKVKIRKDFPSTSTSFSTKGKAKAKEQFQGSSSSSIAAVMPPPSHPPSRRDHYPRKVKDGVTHKTPDDSESSAIFLTPSSLNLNRKNALSPSSSHSPLDKPDRTHRSSKTMKRDSTISRLAPTELPERPVTHVPSILTIKRVRLYQRPRPAVYTHPLQIPPRPSYRNSVGEFLNSFTILEDGVDPTRDELENMSHKEAKTRARIRELRRQGRLLLDIPELPDGSFGISSLSVANGSETPEVTRNNDHYDHLISAASQKGLLFAAEYAAKRALAKKVARLIILWHTNKEGTEEKQRKAESLRIKTLAKFTIKEVERQWKKAVMAVREHNRALLAAEETRLGQKHLDAILDQSGAILEAQHSELSRARSRSSSARDWSGSEQSDNDAQDDAVASENDVEGELSEDYMADEKEEDASAAWLLGAETPNLPDSRTSFSDLEDSVILESEDIPPRGSVPRESPPSCSECSQDALPMSEDVDVSISGTPSEVTLENRPSTEAKMVLAASSAVNTTNGRINEGEILQMEDPSEGHSSPATDDDPSVDSNNSFPRKGNPKGIPISLAPQNRDDLAMPSLHRSTSPIHSICSPQSLPQRSTGSDPLNASQIVTQANKMNTPETEEIFHPGSDGHKSVPVRLSNGVVIYRDIDASSPREHLYDNNTENGASRQLDSPVSERSLDVMNVTQHSLDNVAKGQVVDQRRNAKAGPSHPLAEPVSSLVSVDDCSSLKTSSMEAHPDSAVPVSKVADAGLNDQLLLEESDEVDDPEIEELQIAPHLVDFAAALVDWDPSAKVNSPFLLRGTLRPYQHTGLEWLASLHTNNLNGILADEMGLGKTIQTISLLAHLACDRGIWGPHLIVVPTSVLLNWEMEFKKFLPGFKILSYHGSTKRRKELRVGWNNKHHFNVCVTSYTLASRDAHIFKRKSWYYMILDEAHMIKNFKSQRWNILLMFRSFRRLLLTGTPLQNNLTELWALLQFLMSGTNFANLKEFGDWFSNPLEKAIEQGNVLDEETQERVKKLHTVLRPYLLRRLKADVEKELPSKYEHLVMCRLSKRQRFLYDEFMSRAQTRDALASGVYHQVANILMQLRKVCNHPDLFEVRPIVTSFAMPRSATIDFEIKELLVRRRFLQSQEDSVNLDFLGLAFVQHQGNSLFQARSTRTLDATSCLPFIAELPGEPPPVDTRTIDGFKRHMKHQQQVAALRQWTHLAYVNRLRCAPEPVFGLETITAARRLSSSLRPISDVDSQRPDYFEHSSILPMLVKSYMNREDDMAGIIDRFAFATPPVVARDMASIALSGLKPAIFHAHDMSPGVDTVLHRASVKLQIAFPDASLIQYDCGKLQELASLLHKRKAGGHRVLIFTQMTKVLDILEIFLNFHGYRYLRLDGATKIEDRQYITERFNTDDRVFAFIASSRSGGVGINLTGADTVVFYDSDFNPQMDRQCEDRAHRIGQIRDVHIYRFISEHTVEESMLRKANQKRSLDNIVIQQGEFDWRSLLIDDEAFGKALGEFEDREDAHAARVAAREEAVKEVEDRADFTGETDDIVTADALQADTSLVAAPDEDLEPEEEGTIADYMLAFVKRDWEYFSMWR